MGIVNSFYNKKRDNGLLQLTEAELAALGQIALKPEDYAKEFKSMNKQLASGKAVKGLAQFVEYEKYGRGIGIVDMIRAIESDTEHKANIDMAYHTTDVILSMEEAIDTHSEIKVNSTTPKPDGLWTNPETILWK